MFQQYEAELQEVLADAEARLGALLAAAGALRSALVAADNAFAWLVEPREHDHREPVADAGEAGAVGLHDSDRPGL